jgi:uncharacterized protein YraI
MRMVQLAVLLLAASLIIPVPAARAQDNAIVTAQAYRTVNVRSGPSTQYPVIGQLMSGMIVNVTARSDSESNWLRISFGGQEGWVAYFTVTVIGITEQLPIAEPLAAFPGRTPNVTPTPAPNQRTLSGPTIEVFRRVNVRSGPGMNYERITTLEPGFAAEITGRTGDSEWLRIETDDGEGWVAYFVVSVNGRLASVPVIVIADGEAAAQLVNSAEITTRFNANLRAEPRLRSDILTVVPYNTMLQATARTEASNWLRVLYDEQLGWLLATLVNVDPEASLTALPVAGAGN